MNPTTTTTTTFASHVQHQEKSLDILARRCKCTKAFTLTTTQSEPAPIAPRLVSNLCTSCFSLWTNAHHIALQANHQWPYNSASYIDLVRLYEEACQYPILVFNRLGLKEVRNARGLSL